MLVNFHHRSSLNLSPYQLIFGTESFSRLLFLSLMNDVFFVPQEFDVPEFYRHTADITKRLIRSWKSLSGSSKEAPVPTTPKYSPQVNDRVFVLREKPGKHLGHYVRLYTVKELLSPNSVLVLNPVTRSTLVYEKPCTEATILVPFLIIYFALQILLSLGPWPKS
ncbi:hypothetical protein P9112_001547 [Eukaryota sp. TZLM1-RC]